MPRHRRLDAEDPLSTAYSNYEQPLSNKTFKYIVVITLAIGVAVGTLALLIPALVLLSNFSRSPLGWGLAGTAIGVLLFDLITFLLLIVLFTILDNKAAKAAAEQESREATARYEGGEEENVEYDPSKYKQEKASPAPSQL